MGNIYIHTDEIETQNKFLSEIVGMTFDEVGDRRIKWVK